MEHLSPVNGNSTLDALAFIAMEQVSTTSLEGRAIATARIIRTPSAPLDETSLHMAGVTLPLPSPNHCVSLEELRRPNLDQRRARQALQLLDIGAIVLENQGTISALNARPIPDVTGLISGVLYTLQLNSESLPTTGSYTVLFEAKSRQEDSPIVLRAEAPGYPLGLKVAETELARGAATLVTGGPLSFQWLPGRPEDLIYIDIMPKAVAGSANSTAGVRCSFQDMGQATIPPWTNDQLDESTVLVHRLHRERYQPKGFAAAELRFDQAIAFDIASKPNR
jgi:hypothetical protein